MKANVGSREMFPEVLSLHGSGEAGGSSGLLAWTWQANEKVSPLRFLNHFEDLFDDEDSHKL